MTAFSAPAPAGNGSPRNPLLPFENFRASAYFSGLDGLRAISIFLVLLHHLPRFESPLLQILQDNGRYGVSFFFAISGFLICTLLLREKRETGRISLGRFYTRRAFRLFPLYYAVLAFQALVIVFSDAQSAAGEALFWQKLPSYFFYYSNLLPTATEGPFFFAWSLAAEEQFYLLASLLLLFLPGNGVVILTVTALVIKFVTIQLFGNIDATSTFWRIALSYQEPILWGVLLAFVLESRRGYEAVKAFVQQRFVVSGAALLGIVWLFTHPFESQSKWDSELLFVTMTIVLAGVAMAHSPSVLGRGIPAHVGRISYGIYLLHYFMLVAVTRFVPGGSHPMICLLTSSTGLVLLASAVFKYFEHPLAAYGKRRFSPRRAQPLDRSFPPHPAQRPRRCPPGSLPMACRPTSRTIS